MDATGRLTEGVTTLLRRRSTRWLLLVLAAGVVWRVVRYALVFPMWGDEAFVAVNVVTRGFSEYAGRLDHDMVAPIGFLLGERAVGQSIGFGEAALRLLPFLAGLAALFLFARLAVRRLGRLAALVAVGILAASYYPVRHAAEVKPYAFDLLAAAVLVPLAWRLLDDGTGARRAPLRATGRSWLAFGAASAIAVWFSYPAVFVAGGALLVLVARSVTRRRPGAAALGAAAGLGLLASFVAMYLLVGRHQQWSEATAEGSGQWGEHFPPLAAPWRLPLWFLRELTGNLFAYPNGGANYGCAVTTLLVIAGAVSLWRRGRRSPVLLLLSPLVPMFVAAALEKYPFGGSARIALDLAVPICLLAGQGVVAIGAWALGARRAPRVAVAAAVVLAAYALAGAALDVAHPYKKESDRAHRDAIRALAADSAPGDRWVVFGSGSDVPGVPNLSSWGGTPALLRYHLHVNAKGPVVFGPAPDEIPRADGHATWVIVLHDNKAPFPDALWASYEAAVEARLGPPRARRGADLGDGPAHLDFLRFGGAGG